MKDAKVSVVQTHRDARSPESASRLCLRGFRGLTTLPADARPPGSAQPGRTAVLSRTNRVVKLSIHQHCRGASARIYGSAPARKTVRKANETRRRRGRKGGTCTSWVRVFQHHRRGERSPRRASTHGRPEGSFTSAGVLEDVRVTHSRRRVGKWSKSSELSYSRRRRRGMV